MPSEEAEDCPPPLHVSVLQRWLWATYLRDLEKEREGLWFLSRESDLSLLLSLERDLLETAAQEGCNTRTKLNSLRWHGCLKRLPLGRSGFSEGKPFQGYENNQLVPSSTNQADVNRLCFTPQQTKSAQSVPTNSTSASSLHQYVLKHPLLHLI